MGGEGDVSGDLGRFETEDTITITTKANKKR